jgi:hypothetical protein
VIKRYFITELIEHPQGDAVLLRDLPVEALENAIIALESSAADAVSISEDYPALVPLIAEMKRDAAQLRDLLLAIRGEVKP